MSENVTSPNGGPRNSLTWANIISLVTVLFVAAAGGWAIFQTQFSSLEKSIAFQANVNEEASKVLAKQLTRSYDEIAAALRDIHQELRHDYLSQNEFRQFKANLDVIQKRIDVIETSRPTTGELSSTATAVAHQISVLQDQVNTLGKSLAETNAHAARNPVESREIDLVTNELGKRMDALSKRLDDIVASKAPNSPPK